MKYSNIDFTNDVKVLGRVVSIAMDNKIAEAEQVFDTPFKYNDVNKFHIDENKTGLDQYEINRLFRDKIWAMDNAGLVPDANNELHITNKAVFEGDTVFNDDANFNKGINVKGDINDTEGKITTPEIDADFGKFVRAEVTSTGDDAFRVHGKITANNLDVNGIIHAIGGLTVDGKSIFNDKVQITKGGIDVTGSSVFHDFVKFEDKIEVDGEAKFNGKVIIKNGDTDVDLDWIIEKINYLLECCEEVKNGGGTTPTPTPTPTKYTLTYKDGSTTLSTQQYEAGATISPISNPTKNGYTFAGWSPALPSTMPSRNLTVTAQWTENTPDPGPQPETKYTITYMDGEDVLDTQEYAYGDAITPISDPTKDGYSFAGWSPTIPTTMPDSNLTVTARWTEDGGDDDISVIVRPESIELNPNDGYLLEVEVVALSIDGINLDFWSEDESIATVEHNGFFRVKDNALDGATVKIYAGIRGNHDINDYCLVTVAGGGGSGEEDGPIDIWAFGDNAYTTGFDKPDSSSASPTRMNDAERATWHEQIDGEGSVTVYFYPVEGYEITGASVELDERSSTIHNNETVSSLFAQAGTVNGTPYYSVTFDAVYNDFDPNDSDAHHNMHIRITTTEDGSGSELDKPKQYSISHIGDANSRMEGVPMAVYGPNGGHICHAYAKDGYKISSVNVKLGTSYDDNGNPATDVTDNTDYCSFYVVDDTEWTVTLSNINSNVGILVNTVAEDGDDTPNTFTIKTNTEPDGSMAIFYNKNKVAVTSKPISNGEAVYTNPDMNNFPDGVAYGDITTSDGSNDNRVLWPDIAGPMELGGYVTVDRT